MLLLTQLLFCQFDRHQHTSHNPCAEVYQSLANSACMYPMMGVALVARIPITIHTAPRNQYQLFQSPCNHISPGDQLKSGNMEENIIIPSNPTSPTKMNRPTRKTTLANRSIALLSTIFFFSKLFFIVPIGLLYPVVTLFGIATTDANPFPLYPGELLDI